MKVTRDTPGGEILKRGHEVLLAVADRRRTLLEQSARATQTAIDAEALEEVAWLTAMADVVLHIFASGEAYKAQGHRPPEWVLHCAGQARVALIDDESDAPAPDEKTTEPA